MAETRRRPIPLRWILASSFLTVFGLILLAGGTVLYAELDRLLWITGLGRMESHVHATLHDLGPLGNAEPRSLEGIRFQPMTVPADFMGQASARADQLSGGIYRVEVLDPEGRVVGRDSGPVESELPHDLNPLRQAAEGFLRGQRGAANLRASYREPPDKQVLIIPLASRGQLVGFLQVTTTWRFAESVMTSFASFMLFGLLAMVAVTLALAVRLSRRLTRPLERLAETARQVAGGDLAARTRLGEGAHEIYEVAHTFDAMVERLQEAFDDQRRFVADASHELKTPLTALSGMTQMLRVLESRPETGPQRAQALDRMERAVERMERLVGDLLLLSRAEQPDVPVEPVRLQDLMREAAAEAPPGRKLEVVDEGREEWLLGDPEALRRLLGNLLDNAFQYTPPEGEVRLVSRSTPEAVMVLVEDTGCGVAPEHLARLGQRFYRADASRARQSGGTGLGLAICRAIAAQHGGSLAIESQPGRGTRVTVTLPRPEAEI